MMCDAAEEVRLFVNNNGMSEEGKLHIKVVTNKEKTKVLFAEAGSEFTDVVLSIMLLPLGTIVKVLQEHFGDTGPVLGSLNTLYRGLADLDTMHFKKESHKKHLLTPASCYEGELHRLRFNLSSSLPRHSTSTKQYDGVFTRSTDTFIITDDLRILPNVAGSMMETLSTLGIPMKDIAAAETRDFTFGLTEMMNLLRESLISLNPLTAIVYPGSRVDFVAKDHISFDPVDLHHEIRSMNPKQMVLKVTLQKSTNRLLYAQSDYSFIDFLFRMLTIPVGKIEWFLGSNSGLKSMDNMHRSIKNMNLKHSYTKDLLTKSYCYGTVNEFAHLNFALGFSDLNFVDGVRNYMVSDDLAVTPLGVTSSLLALNELQISLDDVEELELEIGLEEGLGILKAALISKTALTDGLIKPSMDKAHREKLWGPDSSIVVIKKRLRLLLQPRDVPADDPVDVRADDPVDKKT